MSAAVAETAPRPPARGGLAAHLRLLGPGMLIAATGVGAGDVVAAAVAGSRYGYAVVWAVALGAILKYVLNEGIARWQLATGTTILEGWTRHLGRWVQWVFLIYLLIWSFVVGGALISACGLAAHAIAPGLSVKTWGIVHSLAAAILILGGGYLRFEQVMKAFVGIMFLGLAGCALLITPPAETVARSIVEAGIPAGGVGLVLSVMGGIGGSVTLLSYGYWIREERWEGAGWMRMVRLDLAAAYLLTGLFGLAVIVLAAAVLHGSGAEVKGSQSVLTMAEMLGSVLGASGIWAFRIGFWAAVATSILGVWQGVPYIFCDFVSLMKEQPAAGRSALTATRSRWYRGYLLYLAAPPMALLFMDQPVAVIVLYAAVGSLFMPFLAGTLLFMNTRSAWVGPEMRSGWMTNGILVACLVLFGYLGWTQVVETLGLGG